MKALFKALFLLILLFGFLWISSIEFVDKLSAHIIGLVLILSLCWLRFSFNKMINEIRLLLPFVLTMLGIYVLIGLIGIRTAGLNFHGHSAFIFWLMYGLTRTVLFINTIIFMQVLLSYITINDILAFPMKISGKRYLLLGRALFVHSIRYIEELDFHLKLMPEYQYKKMSLAGWFRLKLQLSLAVIVMVLRESRVKGELIDNRITHCFKEQ